MSKEEIWLTSVLLEWYGGPVLSFEEDKFVLQLWGDASVGRHVLGQGRTLKELMENYNERQVSASGHEHSS